VRCWPSAAASDRVTLADKLAEVVPWGKHSGSSTALTWRRTNNYFEPSFGDALIIVIIIMMMHTESKQHVYWLGVLSKPPESPLQKPPQAKAWQEHGKSTARAWQEHGTMARALQEHTWQ
jgi:hypothetical protein